tara:strand:+ start:2497 stop:3315 length:819 start_codon:yes stop_codon:yes gene_type:complete
MKPKKCLITGDEISELIFNYEKPPEGEIKLNSLDEVVYKRQIWKFTPSNHFVSSHNMDLQNIYEGEYLEATYENEKKMSEIFEKIIYLPDNESDNVGRFKSIQNFSKNWFVNSETINLLDIGSGTGVFPYIVKKNGWNCLAIDPDERSVNHLINKVKVEALHGDFFNIKPIKKFDIVTLNKVLEHVQDPIKMLSLTKDWVEQDGFVYIEVPDGEMSSLLGKNRGEFFIDHFHIFSIASVSIMANRAGFYIQNLTRLNEPSDKYTIRAFLSKT